jgi:iron complex transport system permease protein
MKGKGRILALAALSIVLIAGAAFVGEGMSGKHADFIFWQLRVPRVLVGVMVGATLALAGAVFQALFANPLAAPSTIGTTAGAAVGALFALVFDVFTEVQGLPIVTLAAFAGAFAASSVVAMVASTGRARMSDVLLAGIAVTLAASALSSGIQYMADMRALFSAAQWSLGQLPQVGYDGAIVMAPFVLVSTVSMLALGRSLQALAIGEDVAAAQGVDVRRLRLLALVAGSLGVAAVVAWCGPIAFVGLIVPHIVRLLLGPSLRVLLPMSLLVGAAFLVACDALARVVFPGRELPVGVLTAAIGAPTLIALIARGKST